MKDNREGSLKYYNVMSLHIKSKVDLKGDSNYPITPISKTELTSPVNRFKSNGGRFI